jgi:hypothetical protein
MNWKLVATLIVGSSLLAACGTTGSQAPVNDGDTRTKQVEAPSGGAEQGATTTPPGAAPAATPGTQNARPNIVVHD